MKWTIYSLDYMCAVLWEWMKQKAAETGAEISIDSGIFLARCENLNKFNL